MKVGPLPNFERRIKKMSDEDLVKTLNVTSRFSNLSKYRELVEKEVGKRELNLDFSVEGKIGRWHL
jgi:hypothetical protein